MATVFPVNECDAVYNRKFSIVIIFPINGTYTVYKRKKGIQKEEYYGHCIAN